MAAYLSLHYALRSEGMPVCQVPTINFTHPWFGGYDPATRHFKMDSGLRARGVVDGMGGLEVEVRGHLLLSLRKAGPITPPYLCDRRTASRAHVNMHDQASSVILYLTSL